MNTRRKHLVYYTA